MNKISTVLILSAHCMTATAIAGTMGSIKPDSAWVGSISAGPVWESGGRTQSFYLTPDIEKSYIANQSTNVLFNGELFLGIQKTLTPTMQGQIGLTGNFASNANLDGVIWDDADPQFDNYVYRYKIQHAHVAIQGKLLADTGSWFIPWVSGSIGVGFNNAHDYHSVPTIYEALPTPDFASHTQTAFTYTIGAGVQKPLNEHWQAGVGYAFADWGKSRLGLAEGQTLNTGPRLNHLYTNGIMFNLTYLS